MIEMIYNLYNGRINSIAEIGSAHGRDAHFLAQRYGVVPNMVHVVEPRPDAANQIRKDFSGFHVHQIACSDYNRKKVKFHISHHLEGSSLRDRAMDHEQYLHHDHIRVDVYRWEDYVDKKSLPVFDLVKIDVEGCTFEVLKGFGRYRNQVKIYHLECEDIHFWKGQNLTEQIVEMMKEYTVAWQSHGQQKDIILMHNSLK